MSSVTAPASLLNVFSLWPDSKTLGQWRVSDDYQIWTDRRPVGQGELTLWEQHGRGVVRVPDNKTLMHVISAGTSYHVANLFGYWRRSAADTIWFRIQREGIVHHVILMGGDRTTPTLRDTLHWICPACATSFGEVEVVSQRRNPSSFQEAECAAVNAFNASDANRKCPGCGEVHPPAYSFRSQGAASTPDGQDW
ncbi:MAG: hypothetical protein QM696_04480 [Steroidobacteraceae bacterium]